MCMYIWLEVFMSNMFMLSFRLIQNQTLTSKHSDACGFSIHVTNL